MNKLHEKSPCCRVAVRRFGQRRRQCSSCQKTWRLWKRKRGRKLKRLPLETLLQYFKGASKTNLQKRTFSARLRIVLKKFNEETPWPEVPDGPLIVIADGLLQPFQGEMYTLYVILVRSISGNQAIILPPYLRSGGEVALGWREAFAQLPSGILSRVEALVCDGHGGLVYLAKDHLWLLQRCHFHLLARIAHNASLGPLNKNKGLGKKVKNLVGVILYDINEFSVILALEALKKLKQNISSRNFKTVISGFIKHHQDYRTYLENPTYFLPTTSNSAESLNAQIRDLQYRAKGFRTPNSFFAWITAFCKYKKSITCRGKIQPN